MLGAMTGSVEFVRRNRMLSCLRWIVSLGLIATIGALSTAATAAPQGHKASIGWQFGYDTKGRVASVTNPANKRTKFRYAEDQNGRLRSITREYPSGARVIDMFDTHGQRIKTIDGAGGAEYRYDKHRRLIRVERAGHPPISYSYDSLGRVRSVAIGKEFAVRYTYDFLGRPEKIETPAGAVLYSFDSSSNTVSRRLPNGIVTRHVFGPDGALEGITHASANGRTVGEFRYDYRLDGLVTQIRELSSSGVRTTRYEYDTVKRLTSVAIKGKGTARFTYDALGNMTARQQDAREVMTGRYDWAGRLAKRNGGSCRHDAEGNLIGCDGDARTFGYTETGQLASVTDGTHNVRYQYDGDGFLVRRETGGRTHYFLNDPYAEIWKPIRVADAQGLVTYYIWEGDAPLMAISGSAVRYFLQDHRGSIRLVADTSGNIDQRHDYGPFGALAEGPISNVLRPGFTGLYHDPAAGLILTRARAFDPAGGRFLQPDPEHRLPLGSQKDFSDYVYCGGDPVNFIDLNGASSNYFLANIFALRSTWLEAMGASYDFYSHVFKGGKVEFGAQPGSTADQAFRMGGVVAGRTVQAASITGIGATAAAATLKTGAFLGTSRQFNAGYVKQTWRYIRTNTSSFFSRLTQGSVTRSPNAHYRLGGQRLNVSVGNIARPQQYMVKRILPDLAPRYTEFVRTGVPQLGGRSFNNLQRTVIGTVLTGTVGSTAGPALQYFGRVSALDTPSFSDQSHQKSVTGSILANPDRQTFSFPKVPQIWDWGVKPVYASQHHSLASNNFTPTKVGGIRLAGAGAALSHLGTLEGLALDQQNGGLVLLAKGDRPVALPPLRLDDVVTVFRAVYQHGQAPSVSIDPLSGRETERFMKIRHGPGTANTYVGWVLYEADRIMKSYHLGKDNKTRLNVRRLPGYRDFHRYTGASYRQVWERFWIVPAQLERSRSASSGLTLFDVPLKVAAERMEWSGDKLVTARNSLPTPSGRAFRDWFTRSYDRIAEAVTSTPPTACGAPKRVPVFRELRRIALVTAIAETLRDQGEPMPAWMRDYPVRPCPIDETTPILRVTKDNVRLTGGVRLAAADDTVRDLGSNPAQEGLARMVSGALAAKPLLSPVSVAQGGTHYRAVALPGARSEATGANVLGHTDVGMTLQGGFAFGVTRQFHSFFAPDGMFGAGWTLDLPRLEQQPLPVSDDGRTVRFRVAYELTSPLNSWSARFTDVRRVPEVNASLMVPTRKSDILGLADSRVAVLGIKTKLLIFRDGRRWHFDEQGYLVARVSRNAIVTYRRDTLHRIHFIKAWTARRGGLDAIARAGTKPDAELRFDYLGIRVQAVEGFTAMQKTTIKARYFYDKSGKLAMIVSTRGTIKYTYHRSLVTSVAVDDKVVATYTYTVDGRLQTEAGPDGSAVSYETVETSTGTKMIERTADSGQMLQSVEYDSQYRPVRQNISDGSLAEWRETPDHLETVLTEADGGIFTIRDAKNGRQRALETPTGESHLAEFDKRGRLTRMKIDGGPNINQNWHADGRVKSIISNTQAVLPDYSREGQLRSVVVTTPAQAARKRFTRYAKASYDARGRITGYEDYGGTRIQAVYNKAGNISVIRSRHADLKVAYDPEGRASRIETSWGQTESYSYDRQSGTLERVVLQRKGLQGGSESETLSFQDGRLASIEQSDGGVTAIAYHPQGSAKGLVQAIRTPNNVQLSYDYGIRKRVSQIIVMAHNRAAYRIRYKYDSSGRVTALHREPVGNTR